MLPLNVRYNKKVEYMIKEIKCFLLASVALGFLQLETSAMIADDDERYMQVRAWAKEIKKKIKFFETEVEKEKKKPGDESSFTFRYLEITKALGKLKEEKQGIDKLWNTLDWNNLTSDDEEELQ